MSEIIEDRAAKLSAVKSDLVDFLKYRGIRYALPLECLVDDLIETNRINVDVYYCSMECRLREM